MFIYDEVLKTNANLIIFFTTILKQQHYNTNMAKATKSLFFLKNRI